MKTYRLLHQIHMKHIWPFLLLIFAFGNILVLWNASGLDPVSKVFNSFELKRETEWDQHLGSDLTFHFEIMSKNFMLSFADEKVCFVFKCLKIAKKKVAAGVDWLFKLPLIFFDLDSSIVFRNTWNNHGHQPFTVFFWTKETLDNHYSVLFKTIFSPPLLQTIVLIFKKLIFPKSI